tara:strand:+ start:103 stop:459 length:357 start_codon:yes stop_codon:yes gene_type:complete
MKPERKLWHDLKKNTQDIIWNRIENLVGLGLPDLLGYNRMKKYFTVELKIASGNKVRLSPHQISYHVQHPVNSYILIRKHEQLMLVTGAEIMELAANGFGSCAIIADSWATIQRVLSP